MIFPFFSLISVEIIGIYLQIYWNYWKTWGIVYCSGSKMNQFKCEQYSN